MFAWFVLRGEVLGEDVDGLCAACMYVYMYVLWLLNTVCEGYAYLPPTRLPYLPSLPSTSPYSTRRRLHMAVVCAWVRYFLYQQSSRYFSCTPRFAVDGSTLAGLCDGGRQTGG